MLCWWLARSAQWQMIFEGDPQVHPHPYVTMATMQGLLLNSVQHVQQLGLDSAAALSCISDQTRVASADAGLYRLHAWNLSTPSLSHMTPSNASIVIPPESQQFIGVLQSKNQGPFAPCSFHITFSGRVCSSANLQEDLGACELNFDPAKLFPFFSAGNHATPVKQCTHEPMSYGEGSSIARACLPAACMMDVRQAQAIARACHREPAWKCILR